MSVTYTTAHSNARSLTHCVRPGIEPATPWFLVGFISTVPQWELQATNVNQQPYQRMHQSPCSYTDYLSYYSASIPPLELETLTAGEKGRRPL